MVDEKLEIKENIKEQRQWNRTLFAKQGYKAIYFPTFGGGGR